MDFAEIYPPFEAKMLADAYETVNRLGLWEWFKQYRPHANEGFMFSSAIEIAEVGRELKYADHHSGASFGWTMRVLHNVATKGWEAHKEAVLERKKTCTCYREKGLTGWCGVAGGGVPACQH